MRWTTRAAGAALATAILFGAGIGASRPAGAQVNPLSSEVALQSAANTDPNAAPAVAAGPAGELVAAWQRQTGGSYQIFARLFDRTGTPLGAEVQVNAATSGCHRFPAVASDAAGNFVVAWQSEPGSGGSDIVIRKFNAAGTALSGEVTVDSTPAGTGNTNAAVAMAPNGEFLVVWQSNVASGGGWGIYGQAFTGDATPRLTGVTQFEVSPAGTAGRWRRRWPSSRRRRRRRISWWRGRATTAPRAASSCGVFIGKDLGQGDAGKLYFQDVDSYLQGVRFAAASDNDSALFTTEPVDKPWIFHFEQALDLLLKCSLRRAASSPAATR